MLLLLIDGKSWTELKLPMGSSPSVAAVPTAPGIASWCLQRSWRVLGGGMSPVCLAEIYLCTRTPSMLLPWPRDQALLAVLHSLRLAGLASLPLSNAPFFQWALWGLGVKRARRHEWLRDMLSVLLVAGLKSKLISTIARLIRSPNVFYPVYLTNAVWSVCLVILSKQLFMVYHIVP